MCVGFISSNFLPAGVGVKCVVQSFSLIPQGRGAGSFVTSAGLISDKVVKVDTANDLALLKAEGKFSPLPVAASRGVKLGGTVATNWKYDG